MLGVTQFYDEDFNFMIACKCAISGKVINSFRQESEEAEEDQRRAYKVNNGRAYKRCKLVYG